MGRDQVEGADDWLEVSYLGDELEMWEGDCYGHKTCL
jgi:hypothetical protein